MIWGVFLESEMPSTPMIVPDVGREDASEMRLVDDDHVIETFSSVRSDQGSMYGFCDGPSCLSPAHVRSTRATTTASRLPVRAGAPLFSELGGERGFTIGELGAAKLTWRPSSIGDVVKNYRKLVDILPSLWSCTARVVTAKEFVKRRTSAWSQ